MVPMLWSNIAQETTSKHKNCWNIGWKSSWECWELKVPFVLLLKFTKVQELQDQNFTNN